MSDTRTVSVSLPWLSILVGVIVGLVKNSWQAGLLAACITWLVAFVLILLLVVLIGGIAAFVRRR